MITTGFSSLLSTTPDKQGGKSGIMTYLQTAHHQYAVSLNQKVSGNSQKERRNIQQTAQESAVREFMDRAKEFEQGWERWSRA